MAGSLLRTFICIDIPCEHIEKISKWTAKVRRDLPQIRWVDPRTIHITLKFCGEIPCETTELLTQKLKSISKIGPMSLSIKGIGGFPNLSNPRIVWCGIDGDTAKLRTIQKEIENIALYAGINRENRPYSPHITLGRKNTQTPLTQEEEKILTSHSLESEPWYADKVILMKSELKPSGPIYTPLALFKFT